jgi:U4/U6 small nuclear ribonucleoprotein PRP3
MKARIADQTRKAAIDEIPSEKNFVVEAPPEVEWFDESYFPEGKTYNDFDDSEFPGLISKVSGAEGLISDLVQHPVLIEPPQDRLIPEAKPLYMTRKEQKKLRRQRRIAIMKESQAKQRLDLEPTPAPKVKRSNLMRILGDEAIQDPTAVEARVNREIAERHQKHLDENEERKLSKEQRHEKTQVNQEKDAAKGLHMVVFKINNLTDGKHRFKIAKNAEQLALTGICLLHRKVNLVIAEGGEWSISKYKKLMLNRIEWTAGVPTTNNQEAEPDWMKENTDLSTNSCQLIFHGEVKTRAFRRWTSKICETDREVVELLSRNKMESFWAQAINNP